MDDIDYADAIVSFFLEKRGKGSAESSRDQVRIERWERDGVPLDDALAAIAMAFERSVEPPKSVSACGRWLAQVQKAAARAAEGAAAEFFEPAEPAARSTAPSSDGAAQPVAPTAADHGATELLARLDAVARTGPSTALAHAATTLGAEVRELLAETGTLDDVTRAALPEAWVDLVLDALAPAEAAALRAEATADVGAQGLSRLATDEVRRERTTAALCRAIARRWPDGSDPFGSGDSLPRPR